MLLLVIQFTGCESGGDCFRPAGDTIRQDIPVAPFSEIFVNEDIEMILSQGPEFKVVVETGEHLIDDFKAEVTEGRLILSMENTCKVFRAYNAVRVFVSAPEITSIISSTQFAIRSQGELNYSKLSLFSDAFADENVIASGEFRLQVRVGHLSILANELANFEISGTANTMRIYLADGSVRVYMPELRVGFANIYHRSSQDITLYPLDSVKGELWGTGNLRLLNVPSVIEVKENYKGKLIVD